MASESEAAINEILNLWNHKAATRRLIQQFANAEKHAVAKQGMTHSRLEGQTELLPQKQKTLQSVERLIDSGRISPEFVSTKLTSSYGGLTRVELLFLLEKHKAGGQDLGPYLLARAWKREMDTSDSAGLQLRQLTIRTFAKAVRENRSDFFREIADTIDFLQKEEYEENGNWDHDPGLWWQFHLLLYVLDHPKDKYPIREFIKHFKDEVGTNEMPTAKTIRSFCRKNGIALDSKPGAPKKKK